MPSRWSPTRFTGTGITNSSLDEVDNFISITVLSVYFDTNLVGTLSSRAPHWPPGSPRGLQPSMGVFCGSGSGTSTDSIYESGFAGAAR